eukprot:321586_1
MTRISIKGYRQFSTLHPQKNYVSTTFLLPHQVTTIFVSSAVTNATRVLPERFHSDFTDRTGNSLALTYLDANHSGNYTSLPLHSIIGYISNKCKMNRNNLEEYLLRSDDILINPSFESYLYYCYKQYIQNYYHFHTSQHIDFTQLSKNDYVKCVIIDGRVYQLISNRFKSDNLLERFDIISGWYKNESNGEDIIATFDVNYENEFVTDSFVKGENYQILSTQKLGFTKDSTQFIHYIQDNTNQY